LIQYLDFLNEPLLVRVIIVVSIVLILFIRVLTRKKSVRKENLSDNLNDDVYVPMTTIDGEAQTEIMPVFTNGQIEQVSKGPEIKGLSVEIRPLLYPNEPDQCEYCSIFKDLGTIVCPNCGKPLNLSKEHLAKAR
jgi:hypothetical protein